MSDYIVLPELGEGVGEGTITSIAVAVGETIEEGQTLLEVETDKVVLEIPADYSGTIVKWAVDEGDTVEPGCALVQLQRRSTVEKETDKSPSSVTADSAAVMESVTESIVQSKDKSKDKSNAIDNSASIHVSAPERSTDAKISGALVAAAPSARRLAREIGVDIHQVSGGGLRGRITKSDVKAFAKQQSLQQVSRPTATGVVPKAFPDLEVFGPIRRETLSGIAQTTATNMNHAWSQIPHAWLQEKIDITDLEASRQKHKTQVKAEGGALTLTAILVKAVARAIQHYPRFNAALDNKHKELVYRDYCHVGVAVDTPAGLVVPKVENANEKNLTEIALELSEISTKARARKLTSKNLSGAGFTISNLGGIGLSGIFPIVNWPQVAILGVAASQIEPRFIDGEFLPRLMMPLTLGFDHRVINGAEGARFLQYLKALLEDPFSLLL